MMISFVMLFPFSLAHVKQAIRSLIPLAPSGTQALAYRVVDFVASFAGVLFRWDGDRLRVKLNNWRWWEMIGMVRMLGTVKNVGVFDFSQDTKAAVEVFLNRKFRPWHIWFSQGVMDAGGGCESVRIPWSQLEVWKFWYRHVFKNRMGYWLEARQSATIQNI